MAIQLVFATNNKHKLQEAREILPDFEVLSLEDVDLVADIPETKDTLEGNALDKVKFVHERLGMNCFSDDAGLEVEALGGAPGVFSARYAGEHATFDDNIRKLLGAMEHHTNRKAQFRTIVALILNNNEYFFEGIVRGIIPYQKMGEQGFGYDPVFIPEGLSKSFAEMSAEKKNAISHRGRAMRKLSEFLSAL